MGRGWSLENQGRRQYIQSKSYMPVRRKVVIIVALAGVDMESQVAENLVFYSR
jgi:hypothetical protein